MMPADLIVPVMILVAVWAFVWGFLRGLEDAR
jgi:hypothetical protein